MMSDGNSKKRRFPSETEKRRDSSSRCAGKNVGRRIASQPGPFPRVSDVWSEEIL